MPSVGAGAHEIRVHTELEHRILYVAKFEEAVYVLHAFEKKAKRPPGLIWKWPDRDLSSWSEAGAQRPNIRSKNGSRC